MPPIENNALPIFKLVVGTVYLTYRDAGSPRQLYARSHFFVNDLVARFKNTYIALAYITSTAIVLKYSLQFQLELFFNCLF